jgi:hypothetical protein
VSYCSYTNGRNVHKMFVNQKKKKFLKCSCKCDKIYLPVYKSGNSFLWWIFPLHFYMSQTSDLLKALTMLILFIPVRLFSLVTIEAGFWLLCPLPYWLKFLNINK